MRPQLYEGRELSEYTWADLKNKCVNNDFSGLRIGDYKTVTLTDGEVVRMQIAGIDTYYKTGESKYEGLSHHIDFISRNILTDDTIKWNLTNTNNGNEITPYPYLASNVKNYLNETIYPKLPEDVKAVIKDKEFWLEKRYKEDEILKESTGLGWINIGNLWIPSEYEVFGSIIWGTKGWSSELAVQYPLFANSYMHRIKGRGNTDGVRRSWWLNTVSSNSTDHCIITNLNGGSASVVPSLSPIGVAIGFRIA